MSRIRIIRIGTIRIDCLLIRKNIDKIVEESILLHEFINLNDLPGPENVDLLLIDPIGTTTGILLRERSSEDERGKKEEQDDQKQYFHKIYCKYPINSLAITSLHFLYSLTLILRIHSLDSPDVSLFVAKYICKRVPSLLKIILFNTVSFSSAKLGLRILSSVNTQAI